MAPQTAPFTSRGTLSSHAINLSSDEDIEPTPERRKRPRPRVNVKKASPQPQSATARTQSTHQNQRMPLPLILLLLISSLSTIYGLWCLGQSSFLLSTQKGVENIQKLAATRSDRPDSTGPWDDPWEEDGWDPKSTARIVILTTRSESPYKASWEELVQHTARRLHWTNSTFQAKIFIQEDLSLSSLKKVLKEAQIFLGFGLSLDPSVFGSVDLPPSAIFLDSDPALTRLSRLPLGNSQIWRWYLASDQNNFFSNVASSIPGTPQSNAKAVASALNELLSRRNSDDFLFLILVLINQFETVPEVAATTKGSDLKSIQCMLANCRSEIFACVSDKTCKAGLDCLQSCSFNDQVCQYRCIVSYESSLFSEFALCILQKHNCRNLDAKIPTQPNPMPMSSWHGKPMTHEAAEEILIGWRGEKAAEGGRPFSWLVAAGKNPAYDYFPAQHQIFVRDRGALWYVPVFKVITLDGREVWRKRKYRVRRGPEPGSFFFTVLDNGVTSNEYWRLLDAASDKSWALFFYQGAAKTAGLSYSGAVLATPDGLMPPDPEGRISAALDRGGIKSWELSLVDNRPEVLQDAPLDLAELNISV